MDIEKILKYLHLTLKRHGLPLVMLAAMSYAVYVYTERVISWLAPRVDKIFTSAIELHEEIRLSQSRIEAAQIHNTERLFELHKALQNNLDLNTQKISEIHNVLLAPKKAP